MLSEDFFSGICGPPLAANTAVSKDIGIYAQSLTPSYQAKAWFKKSSSPINCLAVSDTHVYAAQDQKAHVHVYSRSRGNQEALVAFPERVRSLALVGDVLLVGTAEGRLILWEVRFDFTLLLLLRYMLTMDEKTDMHREAGSHTTLSRPGYILHSSNALSRSHGIG